VSDRTILLRIVTPEQVLLEERVVSLRFPGHDGSFGVLPRHGDMVALTESGLLLARTPDGREISRVVHDGFAEVRDDTVLVLTRAAEAPEEIDLERARQAAERARGRLRSRRNDTDQARAEAALRRALMRQRYART